MCVPRRTALSVLLMFSGCGVRALAPHQRAMFQDELGQQVLLRLLAVLVELAMQALPIKQLGPRYRFLEGRQLTELSCWPIHLPHGPLHTVFMITLKKYHATVGTNLSGLCQVRACHVDFILQTFLSRWVFIEPRQGVRIAQIPHVDHDCWLEPLQDTKHNCYGAIVLAREVCVPPQ